MTIASCTVCSTMCNGQALGHALVGSSLLGVQVTTSQVISLMRACNWDWIGLSCHLQSGGCVLWDVNCQILGKTQVYLSMFCLCRACSVLVSCTHAHLLPHCCPNREQLRECMAVMILRDSCVSEALFRVCVLSMGTVSAWHYRF